MTCFKNILLTTDFSQNAAAAIPVAAELARKFGGTLRLLYVFEDTALVAGMPGEPLVSLDWVNAARIEREARLGTLAEKIRKSESVECVPCLREGLGAVEILKAAQELKSDCIVIATHGRTGFSQFMFGSVAEKVVRLSPCPVLTVRPKAG